MSKPPLSTDLGNYTKNLSELLPNPINSKKSPSPKAQRARDRKRGRSVTDLSGGKEGQKTLRTDQQTPPSRTGSTNSSSSSPPSSPSRSLKTLTRSKSQETLSESLALHSPVHSQARTPSPTPSLTSYLTPNQQSTKPLQYQGTPNTPNKSSHSSNMQRPKLLRPSSKDLQNLSCVSAETVYAGIVKDDCDTHEPPNDGPPAIDQVLDKMSNFMLNRQETFCILMDNKLKPAMADALNKNDKKVKDFFKEEGEQLLDLSDYTRSTVCDMLNHIDITTYSHILYVQGRDKVAAAVAEKMPAMIKNNKDFFTQLISPTSRTVTANHEIFSMIIYAANFDSRWKSLLHDSLQTAQTDSSIHTLAAQLQLTKIDTLENTKAVKENHNNILKAARQIGHLKTSQIENSYRAVETQIRIHNINTIKSDDNQDFRNLDNSKQEKEIQALLQQHLKDPKAGTINIFKPKPGAKQFESLALVTFKTTTLKYAFERSFAAWKRDKPAKNEKLTISRAPPSKAPGDDKTHM